MANETKQVGLEGSRGVKGAAKADEVPLAPEARANVVEKKATCPFIGTAVATEALPVRNSASSPLASVDDVVALGNTGGGDLGKVLRFFAMGNHRFSPGPNGELNQPVPQGLFSLDFPGSQGSHAGHSGILQTDPKQPNSGAFSEANFQRLLNHAKHGYVTRSEVGKFIAENIKRDPNSVVGLEAAARHLKTAMAAIGRVGPHLLEKVRNRAHGTQETQEESDLYEVLTKGLGTNNLQGSAGEFGLLFAFFANKPGAKEIDGEPALSVEDLTLMFKEKRFAEGWETWPKTKANWLANTAALVVAADKEYVRLSLAGGWTTKERDHA